MPRFTQKKRPLWIDTPLGEDVLLLREVEGREELSSLFSFQLDLIAESDSISPKDIVGKAVTFSILRLDEEPRPFHGFVRRFVFAGKSDRLSRYRAEVVPWLWFLTRTSDCRIFQEMNALEIVEKIFQEHGFIDFEVKVKGSLPKWEYCVQYRESDFNFVSRILEECGIFYFFRHEEGKHTLVLANSNAAFEDLPENDVSANPSDDFGEQNDGITSWEHSYEFRSGKYSQLDFNFKAPSSNMSTAVTSVVPFEGSSKFEVFDYPGEYETRDTGDFLTRIRMEEEESDHDVVHGTGTYRTFAAGGKLKIARHPSSAEIGKTYYISGIHHFASLGESYVSGRTPAPFQYRNQFTCIPTDVAFRPKRLARKPVIQGLQTAIVTGPPGEEIYTDEFGRVKVQFHWDREGKKNEQSSCWIRVSSISAGKGWGHVSLPRIGQEVIVDFLEGDPDKPIVVGRVFNAEQTVPYPLPAEKTKSTIKTRSSTGGGPANFNEIRFEDKKGEEELYIHAEKDEVIVVENDRSEYVGHDRTLEVEHDKGETVRNNKSIQVDGNHTERVGGAMSVTVDKTLTELIAVNHAETVGGAMELTVGGAIAMTAGGAMALTVGGAMAQSVGLHHSVNVGGNSTTNVGSSLNESVGKDRIVSVTKDLKETVGGQHTETVEKEYILNAKKIQLVATDELQIKVGSAEIVLKKNGDITIKGKKINVTGTGDVTVKGSAIKEN